ncbi:MAG: GIY-YIG nuclease family protein [Syntrophomonadaceae bacterium]|nr:GIY-YIG nuclease family protein [Syntrophomonadaceae bacterium]
MFFVYMLLCADNSYYTGYTNNIENRISCHNDGKGSKYTRARLPVKLAYLEEFSSKSEAMKREAAIKKLKSSEKRSLSDSYLNKEGHINK